jgi:hypothetical protein
MPNCRFQDVLRVLTCGLIVAGTTACGSKRDATADSSQVDSVGRSPDRAAFLTVVATDYAYLDLPDTVSAGLTNIVLENRGQQRHEMALARLRPGISLAASIDVARGRGDPKAVIDSVFNIVVALPGTTSTDTLKVVLEAGRTYAIVCFLADAPGKPEHIFLGMFEGFVAKP